MSTIRFSIILVAALLLGACAAKNSSEFPKGEWIDLSHDFSDETIYWVTAEPFKRTTVAEGVTPGGYYYSAYNFSAAEHGGTHIDAPVHFAEGRESVDKISLDRLIGPAVKLNLTAKAAANRDYQVSVADFEEWEKGHGRIPDDTIVFLQTGWSQYWPDALKYLGTNRRGAEAVPELHFPGLDPEAARWLTANRKIKAIGLDTASIDYGQSQMFESHRVLMGQNIPAFENVTNLNLVPDKIEMVIALPIKIRGGSGGPLRIAAMVNRAQK